MDIDRRPTQSDSLGLWEDTEDGEQRVLDGCGKSKMREVLERRMAAPLRKPARTTEGLPLFRDASGDTVHLEDYLAGMDAPAEKPAPVSAAIDPCAGWPHDPMAIPPFLRRERGSAPRRRERQAHGGWWMPPACLVPVNRAVRDGCDTMQQIKKRLKGRYEDKQIRAALDGLISSGEVRVRGRRYEHTRG